MASEGLTNCPPPLFTRKSIFPCRLSVDFTKASTWNNSASVVCWFSYMPNFILRRYFLSHILFRHKEEVQREREDQYDRFNQPGRTGLSPHLLRTGQWKHRPKASVTADQKYSKKQTAEALLLQQNWLGEGYQSVFHGIELAVENLRNKRTGNAWSVSHHEHYQLSLTNRCLTAFAANYSG